jgi:UDP-N-acetylmuramate dehydrogenase
VTSPVEATARALGDRVQRDHPIGPLTTYRVGGAAALFITVETAQDLAAVRDVVAGTGVATLVVGRGSNLLVADAGFPGLAIALGEGFTAIDIDGRSVRAGAAVSLPVLARQTAAAGLTGLEWAVGVPGSVGGAVRMNAGGHGSDTAEHLSSFCFVDLRGGEDGEFPASRLQLGYRSSTVAEHHVVVWGGYELTPGDAEASAAEISEIVRWRREHQPGGQNAGSVFTNPPGDSAGRLVDLAGLKGHRIGTAHVSAKHANFIQADEGGSADDVWALVDEVRRLVAERTGVHLEPELRVVGFSV